MRAELGGSVLADTAAQHFAQSLPADMRIGTWLCQEMVAPDSAPGRGSRNRDGHTDAPDEPGLGVAPDATVLGEPVAVYGD